MVMGWNITQNSSTTFINICLGNTQQQRSLLKLCDITRCCVNLSTSLLSSNKHVSYFFLLFISINIKNRNKTLSQQYETQQRRCRANPPCWIKHKSNVVRGIPMVLKQLGNQNIVTWILLNFTRILNLKCNIHHISV